MESTKFLTASLLAAGLMAGAMTADAGLVAYFEFDSDFTNSAGVTDGTAVNGAVAGAAGGIVGNAMELRSTGGTANEHMNVGIGYGGVASATDLGTNFTISAWYNLDDPASGSGSGRYFVYEGETTFDASYGIRDLNGTDDTTNGGINDGQFFTANPNGSNDVDNAGLPGWHHVVQTFSSDGTDTTITNYVDGVLAGTFTRPTAGIVDSGINFGAPRSSTTDRGFDGLIDEITLWDHALTAQEVLDLRQTTLDGNAVPEPGSLALLGLGGLLIARRRRG